MNLKAIILFALCAMLFFNVPSFAYTVSQENSKAKNNELYLTELIKEKFYQYAPTASNETLYHYLITELNYKKKLYTLNPKYVLFTESPTLFKEEIKKIFPEMTKMPEYGLALKSEEAVIKSGENQYQTFKVSAADLDKGHQMLSDILHELINQYGEKDVRLTLQDPSNPNLDANIGAQIVISLYEKMVKQQMDNGSLILRAMLTH